MFNSRLRWLFKKYAAGNISEIEYYELLTLLDNQSSESEEEVVKLIQKEFNQFSFDTEENISSKIFDEIFNKIIQHPNSDLDKVHTEKKIGKKKVNRILFITLVAASMAIMLAVGTISKWMFNAKKTSARTNLVQNAVVPKVIYPASNTAVLTLAGGEQIVLDSAHNGILVQQGSSKIINEGGKLNLSSMKGQNAMVVYNLLSTHRANQYQLLLPDGTKVWLNAASSIKFPNVFKGSERKVSVTGEVYFEVAKDANHPFIVDINGINVKVLGTHFNINAYNNTNVSTTLFEGAVQVSSAGKQVLIKPGEAADVGPGNIYIHKANLAKTLAWKNEEFYFEGDPLPVIMDQLSRWYDIDVEYEGGKSLNNEKYSGSISRNVTLSDALKMLQTVTQVNFEVRGRTIAVKTQ